jgi:nucleotide-binding universal stress UspA family protein
MRLLALRDILVATDLDDASSAAVAAACSLAEAAGAVLHAVHVTASADDSHGSVGPTSGRVHALRQMVTRAGARIDPGNVHVVGGDPANTIGALAKRIEASVVVLGPHRARPETNQAPFLGCTARAIVTNASAPCLVVSQPLRLPLERVLVPIDLSDTARGGLLVGLAWASALRVGARRAGNGGDATLTCLHVARATGSTGAEPTTAAVFETELEHARRQAGNWAGVSIEGVVTTSDNIAQSIVDYAAEHQPGLVVLGTRGLGLDRIDRLGSIAAAVLPRLSAPVLLVPPAVWSAFVQTP